MGKMSELWMEEQERKLELEIARAEAAYDALPESSKESLDELRKLRTSVLEIMNEIRDPLKIWRERAWGFVFGIAASAIASLILSNI